MRQVTLGHPALIASGGRLAAWLAWLETSMVAVGLGLLGLSVITYLDVWAYQGMNGLTLWADAARGQSRSTAGFRYSTGQAMGWIEIPRLGILAIVAHGDDDGTLIRAVGHIPGTAFPGEGGNVGLAGHRDTFFRALEGIERFDIIRLIMPDRVLEYGVVDVRVVRPTQVEVLEPTALPSLTLVTCYPFVYVGSAPDRYVVRAEELRDE
jgi:sortase A